MKTLPDLMKERSLKPTMLLARRVAEVIGLKQLFLHEWEKENPLFGGVEATIDGKRFKMKWGLYGNQANGMPMFRYDATWDHIQHNIQAHISAAQLMNETDRRAFAVMVGNRMLELLRQPTEAVETKCEAGDDEDIDIDALNRHALRLGKRMDN